MKTTRKLTLTEAAPGLYNGIKGLMRHGFMMPVMILPMTTLVWMLDVNMRA